jgi:hypothetical protein
VKENREGEKKLENSPTDFTSSGLTAWAALGLQNGYPDRSIKEGPQKSNQPILRKKKRKGRTNLRTEGLIRMANGAAHTNLSA